MASALLSAPEEGPQPRDAVRQTTSCRADLMAATGHFSRPPAGTFVAVSGQFLVAAVTQPLIGHRCLGGYCAEGPSPLLSVPGPHCLAIPYFWHAPDRLNIGGPPGPACAPLWCRDFAPYKVREWCLIFASCG